MASATDLAVGSEWVVRDDDGQRLTLERAADYEARLAAVPPVIQILAAALAASENEKGGATCPPAHV